MRDLTLQTSASGLAYHQGLYRPPPSLWGWNGGQNSWRPGPMLASARPPVGSPLELSRGVREPRFDTVINWPAISLSILLHAEGPANNEVMNSQSDLTIDLLFTIVTANAFNDPPARPHPQQGLRRPRPLGNLWVTLVASNEHPLLSCGQCKKQSDGNRVLCFLSPLPTLSTHRGHLSPPLKRAATSPRHRRLPGGETTFHCILFSEKALLSGYLPPTSGGLVTEPATTGSVQAWVCSICHGHAVTTPTMANAKPPR